MQSPPSDEMNFTSLTHYYYFTNMEVFDFEDDHLASVLPHDREDEDEAATPIKQQFATPTEQEIVLNRQIKLGKLAADKKFESRPSILVHYPTKAAAAAATATGSSSVLAVVSAETDTSSERYQYLPAYAQSTFVEKKKNDQQAAATKIVVPRNVPATMRVPSDDNRQHEILQKTAERVVASPQLEVMIKVKQADNPDLSFLDRHDKYHAYYEWWKKRLRTEEQQRRETAKQTGMQDLLGVYSSSSDDEDDGKDQKKKDLKEADSREENTTTTKRSPPNDEVKARRRKRAKMLEEHFQNKMK